MDHLRQRALGAKLAKAGGSKWEKTLIVIENESSCFEDILQTAALEVGVDELVSRVLEGPPEWAFKALRYVPDLGRHRDALLQKAAEDPKSAFHALRFIEDLGSHRDNLLKIAAGQATPIGPISAMNLKNQGSYICQWTLYWTYQGQTMPRAAYPNWNDWQWAQGTMALENFARRGAPLEAGNTVWMFVWVAAGNNMESAVQFTFDPNNRGTAQFFTSGTTTDDNLGYTGITGR